MPGPHENKASMKGMAHTKRSAGSETIRSEEHVGSSGSHGVRFKMPKESEVCDHSRIREMKE